ncbi:MAG TPA: DUF1501 domain-containing protein [Pirellulaceae bacterium]|nr:DUF1501 domain-containing protein [Pirellulaceae bacterium]
MSSNPQSAIHHPQYSRRTMLAGCSAGIGTLALASLLAEERLLAAGSNGEPVAPSPRATAKRVIFLFMGGGPSQVDTFDPKPLLNELHGKSVPESIAASIPRIARAPLENLSGSKFKFQRHGQSGLEISELFPHVARCADDLCVLRSLKHDSPIHAPAEFIATTGTGIGDRPSLGAWLYYGLGSENRDLPGYIVMKSGETLRPPTIAAGFLPARYQGTLVDGETGIPNLETPDGTSARQRRGQLDLLRRLNEKHLSRHGGDSALEARIQAYELSYRMQMAAPEAFDLSQETAETHALYGLESKDTAEFGKYCLWARRLVERGVRFITLRSGGWDAHESVPENHGKQCLATDQPIAALLTDLKRRGLFSETLVIWGGEFGRTPAAQGSKGGRDHSPSGYSMWLAGGGVRGGQVIGATDPVGYAAIERPIHPNDLHATILHALGIDQRELSYLHHNRREMVTVNGGDVIGEVFG